jgi:lipopolysaccharide export system ATP-binding protein
MVTRFTKASKADSLKSSSKALKAAMSSDKNKAEEASLFEIEPAEVEVAVQDTPRAENIVPIKKPTKKRKWLGKKQPQLVFDNTAYGLHIANLGKSYGGKPAVRDISMVVNRGEAVGLLGPNGAGKTTSFYMTMGLIRPDYGTISLDGVDITNLPVYRRARLGIGYLPQEASIFRGMTVEENILAVLELSEDVAEKRSISLESLLAEFSITHLRRSPAVALSGGERRRVEIARALASNPSFILLDEPLAGVDPVAVADIKELISHLKNRGIGVLITDHNVREALDLIDRAYIIHDGRVLMEGKPEDIVNNPEVRRVYLGEKFSL